MGSRGQGASGCGERSPKVEVLAQVSYPCGLPGCGQEDSWHPQDPGRRAIFHVHLNHLSQLPSEAPLQPRLLPGVSRATRHGAHSHHTQHNGEADTRGFGGWGGVRLGKGSKAGPHDRREAASTSRVQNVPEAKSGHTGHTRRLGAEVLHGGAYPASRSAVDWDSVLPHLSTHMLLPWKMAQAAQAPPVQHAVAC